MEKCLHILPMGKLSGAEKMVLLMCKNIESYKPVVICGGEELKKFFNKNGIESYYENFSNKNLIEIVKFLKDIIEKDKIKIIHAHDNKASIFAYITKKFFSLDSITIISHVHSCYPFIQKKGFNKLVDSIFRKKYDCSILCGNFVFDFYKENTKYFKNCKSYVVPNCIDVENIINKKNPDNIINLRNKFKIPKDKKILGFVGRLCDIKGIVPFIEHLSLVKENFSDCKFLLIGDGDQYLYIKNLIKSLKCEDLFILTGFQENVYDFYPLIDIVFLPSRYEGLPMFLLEAMAFGKAIVSMNVGSINQIIQDGENGYLIPKDNFEEFIKKIEYLKKDEFLISEMGKKSFDIVKREYNLNNYVKEITDIYNSLL